MRRTPAALAVYSGEDRIAADGSRHSPCFKAAWNPDLFQAQDYLSRLLALSLAGVRAACGFAPQREGFEFYDLLLRCLKAAPTAPIVHVPALLYHRREPIQPTPNSHGGIAALQAYFGAASGVTVEPGLLPASFHLRHPLPPTPPKVALIVPTKDRAGLLRACVESLLGKTRYPRFEIWIVDNQSSDPDALAYLAELAKQPGGQVLDYPHPFNYSAINNFAVRQTDAELVGLINNGVEVISPDWLDEMVRHAIRPEIGALG